MKDLWINDNRKKLKVEATWGIRELVNFVRRSYTTHSHLISSLKLDGIELTPTVEERLMALPLSTIQSIEVTTVHRNVLINETMEYLAQYLDQTIELSNRLAAEGTDKGILGLVENLETIFETIRTVKMTVQRTMSEKASLRVSDIEKQLLGIFKDLLAAVEKKDQPQLTQVLREILPQHLKIWRDEGISILVRCNDQ